MWTNHTVTLEILAMENRCNICQIKRYKYIIDVENVHLYFYIICLFNYIYIYILACLAKFIIILIHSYNIDECRILLSNFLP